MLIQIIKLMPLYWVNKALPTPTLTLPNRGGRKKIDLSMHCYSLSNDSE